MKKIALLLLIVCTLLPSLEGRRSDLMAGSFRRDEKGWIFIHLHGTPRQVGFQQGFLLAREIDEALSMFSLYLEKSTSRPWQFFREAAARLFWPKLEPEYREEITAIAEGMASLLPGANHDAIDITALNGWIELAWYYVPWLDEKAKPGAGDRRAPPYCSAFVATGSYTRDGQIVMGHNAWVEYIVGERWNVIADVTPAHGHRFIMDSFPGYIHSGDDFVITEAGLLITETTISQYKGFREEGVPEFMRARKAAQYASSIDDFIRTMSEQSNGAYANDWLVGDNKTGEIARLELGLQHQRVWRTKDGYYAGANYPLDPTLIANETTFDPANASQSVMVRRARWEQLLEGSRGRIDAEMAKSFLADHVDATTGMPASGSQTLCGHVDQEKQGLPEFLWPPFFPGGAVQAKVTSALLASKLTLWARFGHTCGAPFLAAPFVDAHPEFANQLPFLKDMPPHPWAIFSAKNYKVKK